MKKLRLLSRIIASCFIVLVIDVVAGIAYKNINGYAWFAVFESGSLQMEQSLSERTYRIKSYRYHHDLAKNVRNKNNAKWGGNVYTVNTNSLGFKDRSDRQIPLKSEKKRLLFIGDSVTEGIGLNYEKTFVGLIDDDLKEKYSILNAGVLSYSPIIYWKKVEDLINNTGLEFDELIVYLDISDIQDEASKYLLTSDSLALDDGLITDVMYEKPTLQSELIKENTIILAWLRSALKQNQTQPVERTILKKKKIYTYKDAINKDKDRGSWTFDSDTFKEYGERGLNISAKHMDSLLELLIKHKIEMTLGIYPWPSQIYYDTVDSKHVLFWETWAKRNNVKFINHFEDFFLLKDKTGPKQLIEEYYIPGDVHFNEKGNILMKEYFLSQYPQ
ncbi:MAG: hypothetical protein HOJ14_11780 [Nitrospina sp.]|nr:hypothetical protein [Nitrospina sp.]